MVIKFTDSEYGEIIGSLANTRDAATKAGRTAPHVESALAKMCKWGSPAGCQFIVVTDEDAELIANVTEPAQ
jgi:hypothetical protein